MIDLAARRAALVALALAAACAGAPTRPAAPAADPLGEVSGAELYRRGVALARAGDHVRAEQYLLASLDRGQAEDRVVPLLVRVCVEASSRLRAALAHALPYLERHPSAWSLRLVVATLYLGVGEPERARTELERVIADAPTRADAHYLLALVLRDELGDRGGAALGFQRYLALAPTGKHAEEARGALRALPPGAGSAPATPTPTPIPAPTPPAPAPVRLTTPEAPP